MKLLVTGGLGFIGSNFIRHIMNKYPEYRVVNLDKMTYAGNPENLRDIEKDPHYKFVRGCITDENLVNELVSGEKPDTIIHFAAESHVDRSILGSLDFVQTNVMGTRVLLDATKNHKIERFIYICSSDWVVFADPAGYPSGHPGGYPEDEAYFLHFIIHTIYLALSGHPELDAARCQAWVAERHAQVERGELVYIAHQLDILGRKS